MAKPTFADLEKDPKLKKLVQVAEAKHGTPLPEPIKVLMVDLAIKSSMDVQTRVNWIVRLLAISESVIDSTAHESEYPLFWIYLYGVVVEYHSHLQERRELDERVEFMKPILNSMDSILAILSTDDITLIKFMRHSHVHMSLDYIWHHAKMKDGKLSEVKPPFDPNAIDVSNRIINDHGGNQQMVAQTYAKMIIEGLSNLSTAVSDAIS